jgi:hypothetical protein
MSYDVNLDLKMDTEYKFDAYVDVDFDTSNTYSNHVSITESICWTPEVDGNSVLYNVDAQAFGKDTLVDTSIVAITVENEYSSFTATGAVISA